MAMIGVEVTIKKECDYPTPFGKSYKAKGAYVQGKFIVVVGRIDPDNTIRVKYPAEFVSLKFY